MKIEINKEDNSELNLDALTLIADNFSNLEESYSVEGSKYYLEELNYNEFFDLMNLLSNNLHYNINVSNTAHNPDTIYLTIQQN